MKEQSKIFKPLIITAGASLLISLGVLMASAWAVSSGRMSDMRTPAIIAVFAGAFILALGAVAYFRQKTLIVGLTAALAYFLFVFLLGALVYFRAAPTSPVIAMLLPALAAGLIAGIIPVKKKTKRG